MVNLKTLGLAAVGMIALNSTISAQDKVEASVSADFVNQYIWRGQYCGSVSVQPSLGLSYKGFSIGAWGSTELVNQTCPKEFDLTVSYSTGKFNVGITDYWFDSPNERYFSYAAHKTSHIFEANIGYDFGLFSAQWYTNFAGNDGTNKDGDRAYSSYVELSAPFTLGGLGWKATVGAVPFATTLYAKANSFAVTNVSLTATKDIKVTDSFSLPVFAGIATNPSTEKAYFLCGFTLKP